MIEQVLRSAMKKLERTLTGVAVVVAVLGWVGSSSVCAAEPKLPTNWVFTLPTGNPASGKKVFVKMQCFSCHTVEGEVIKDTRVETGAIGPRFTAAYAKLPAGYLAESIINPDRFLPHGSFKPSYLTHEAFKAAGRDDYELHSRMAGFNEIMTVKELVDVVAFLKSLSKPRE